MSSFRLGKKFDAIICVYHGINHLLSFAAWQSFFACAYQHLNDGGVLVFDILTVGNLQMMAAMPKTVEKFGDNYLLIGVRTSDQIVFEWDIEVFELQPGGGYKLLTEVIRTVSYEPEEIREVLGEKFNNIQTIETDGGAVNEDGEKPGSGLCALKMRPGSALGDIAEVFGCQDGGNQVEATLLRLRQDRRAGSGGTGHPVRLVRAQVTRQLAAAARHVEGQDLGCPARDHLTDSAGSQIAHVDHERDRRICADLAGSLAHGPVGFQNAPSSQGTRSAGPSGRWSATRAVSGWARKNPR